MPIVFGSEEARELLRRDGGFEFDLRDLAPTAHRKMSPARHARLVAEVGQAEEAVEGWCRVCNAYARWVDCPTCGGLGSVPRGDDERDCWACDGKCGAWRCDDVDYTQG